MKYLVTGGCGFLGSHVVDRLVQNGHDVLVLDDLSAGKLSNLPDHPRLQFHLGSVCDHDMVDACAEQSDVVLHLATLCLVKGLEDPLPMYRVNDLGTFNICLAAKEHECKIVNIGTSEIYGPQTEFPIKETSPLNPVSIYGHTKMVGEAYVRFFHQVYGVPAVLIRPFNTFGPRQREDAYAGVITSFMKRAEKDLPPIIFGGGSQTRDFTYVTDIVDGIMLLSELEHGEVVNLGSGVETSVLELARLICRREPVFSEKRINDLARLRADISGARSYGYEPKVSLREGLERYVGWYRNQRL